jgi:hypothetical protein
MKSTTYIHPNLPRLASLLEWYGDAPLIRWNGSADQLTNFERRVGANVPELYGQFILNFRWREEVNCEWVCFLPNPPVQDLDGLAESVERDEHLFRPLKASAMVQFGRSVTGANYDPVCFDTRRTKGRDCPVIRVSHEAAVQFGRVEVVEELAPSFAMLLEMILADAPA